MTVKLGCIELENRDLKLQLEEIAMRFESRMDQSRLVVESELDDAHTLVDELTLSLEAANSKLASL